MKRGFMKLQIVAVLAVTMMTACASKPINTATAPSTPVSRVYAPELQAPGNDKVQLIARDAGFGGSGCMRAIYLDGRVVAAIDNGEKVDFYLAPGQHILGTGPNPQGKALCHMGADRMRRETGITLELGKPLKYRLALSANGETSVMPTAF
jgi:hypothetical protein